MRTLLFTTAFALIMLGAYAQNQDMIEDNECLGSWQNLNFKD